MIFFVVLIFLLLLPERKKQKTAADYRWMADSIANWYGEHRDADASRIPAMVNLIFRNERGDDEQMDNYLIRIYEMAK